MEKLNQYVVAQTDFSIGHLFKNGEIYLIFEPKNETLEYIDKDVKENSKIDYLIENCIRALYTHPQSNLPIHTYLS